MLIIRVALTINDCINKVNIRAKDIKVFVSHNKNRMYQLKKINFFR